MENLFLNNSFNTRKERIRFLIKIGITDLNNYDVLNDINNIFNTYILNSNSNGTQKTRIFHIIEFLKLTNNNDLLEKYRKKAEPIINNAINDEKSNTTTKQDRYIKLQDIQKKLLEQIPDIITVKKFEKLKYNEQINYVNKLQDYILLSLYIFTPAIRNNYWTLNIIKYKKDIDTSTNLNYMILNQTHVYIYLQNYKNVSALKSIKIDIDKETQKLIKLYMKLLEILLNEKPKHFLYHISLKKIEPAKENATKTKIIDLSKKYFNIPFSINDYRHMWEIYIQNSEEYKKMTYKQKEKLHNKLLHSIDTALKYNII
jgi:hypothetical protein